ncbi:hypothetical protein skT53_35530 [Effusibacillus dendaii]|uniref:Alkyl hydroperoxide reductase subunit C/ Thiol specific antioxidant domain-containing protein n=2 Tax=Effusibacillus dendaii TaxID=2743772 RepID=A0A7I8DED5_9BACL|nr:hypothetical protein skT53_35530 [Effusibacillus dendaii]
MVPNVGEPAPEFELSWTRGKQKVRLSDYRGRKMILLAFFPLAFTPG